MDAILTGGAITAAVVNAFPDGTKKIYRDVVAHFLRESADPGQSLLKKTIIKIKNMPDIINLKQINHEKIIYAFLGFTTLFMAGTFVLPDAIKIIKKGLHVLAEIVPRIVHFLSIMYLTDVAIKALLQDRELPIEHPIVYLTKLRFKSPKQPEPVRVEPQANQEKAHTVN